MNTEALPELGLDGMVRLVAAMMACNARPDVRVDPEIPAGKFRVWRSPLGYIALVVPTRQDAAGLEVQLDDLFRPREDPLPLGGPGQGTQYAERAEKVLPPSAGRP